MNAKGDADDVGAFRQAEAAYSGDRGDRGDRPRDLPGRVEIDTSRAAWGLRVSIGVRGRSEWRAGRRGGTSGARGDRAGGGAGAAAGAGAGAGVGAGAGAAIEGGGAWQPANPRDEESKGEWWHVYHDAELDGLLARIDVSNQNVKVAEAQFAQARALVRSSRAAAAPTVSVDPSVTRSRVSSTRSAAALQTNRLTNTDYELPFDVSYEADVWGKVKNSVASSKAAAQASAADLETMRLSMRAELAANYFQARALDAEEALLDESAGRGPG